MSIIYRVKLEKLQTTTDHSTSKALLALDDGAKIESVLMKYRDWYSACLSVMVGCPLDCNSAPPVKWVLKEI